MNKQKQANVELIQGLDNKQNKQTLRAGLNKQMLRAGLNKQT